MKAMNRAMTPGTIKFLTGLLAGRTYQLTKPIIYLGCGRSNDIVIPDFSVAYHHARITWEAGGWRIKRLSPRHGLTINEHDEQETLLIDSDIIGLGEGITFLCSISAVSETQISRQTTVLQQISRSLVTTSSMAATTSPKTSMAPAATVST